jgi:hypothetical protein
VQILVYAFIWREVLRILSGQARPKFPKRFSDLCAKQFPHLPRPSSTSLGFCPFGWLKKGKSVSGGKLRGRTRIEKPQTWLLPHLDEYRTAIKRLSEIPVAPQEASGKQHINTAAEPRSSTVSPGVNCLSARCMWQFR